MARAPILALFLLALLAGPARAEEPQAPREGIDPARVGRLLLSDDEDERARGASLLRARMKQGGDAQTWLVAMARAQAAWADADERLVERWIDQVLRGAPEEAERARRLLAAMGREATRRLLQALRDVQQLIPQRAGQDRKPDTAAPQLPVLPVPEANEPLPAPPPVREPKDEPLRPEAPTPAPIGRIEARILEVPDIEVQRGLVIDLLDLGEDAEDLSGLVHPPARVVRRRGLFELTAALPEARLRAVVPSPGFLVVPGRDLVLLEGDVVRYRSRARPTKGAWAVETDTLRSGLQVRVRVEGRDADAVLAIEVRFASIPDPLPTEKVRPSVDVEPLELDRPEWQTASLVLRTPIIDETDEEAVAFFPGLVPEKMVVVGVRFLPPRVLPPAAAREQRK